MEHESSSPENITFDEFVFGHLQFWQFAAILPEDYITREKLKGCPFKVITALHFCSMVVMYGLAYFYLCIMMILTSDFDFELMSNFLHSLLVTP